MRHLCISLLSLLVLGLPTYGFAADDEARSWGVFTSAGVYSDYIFRGKNVYDGASLQPSVTGYIETGDFGAFSANVWAHVPVETNEPPEKFTEVDYTLSYDLYVADIVTLSGGLIFFTFPDGEGRIADTEEFFVGASVNTLLNPSFTFYNDFDEGEYQYYTLGFSEPIEVPGEMFEGMEFTPYVKFAFATNADDGPILYFDDGFVHTDLGVSMDFDWGPLFVSPNFNMTLENDDAASNEFWFGIDLGFEI